MSFHGYRGMALNTLRGKTDFLELAQFCEPEGPLAVQHYYEFLDSDQADRAGRLGLSVVRPDRNTASPNRDSPRSATRASMPTPAAR